MLLSYSMTTGRLPLPTWKRVGFPYSPDVTISGKDIGIVILDRIRPHPALRHLGNRIHYLVVDDDLKVTHRNIAFEEPDPKHGSYGEHGLMVVLTIAHAPFVVDSHEYIGLAPAANIIVLDRGQFREGEGERLRKGMDWLLERRDEWNLEIVLSTGWDMAESQGSLENTDRKPVVQGLSRVLEAGLMVIASNGNTRLTNELPPIEYFAIGCYHDNPFSYECKRKPNLDEPWGRNGDGHLRPDILAPRLYLPIPFCELDQGSESVFSLTGGSVEHQTKLSYFAQSSGTASVMAGICVNILSQYPNISVEILRQLLVDYGDPVDQNESPAPAVDVAPVLKVLEEGNISTKPQVYPPTIRVAHPEKSVHSGDPIERGLALSMLARGGKCNREELWRYTEDDSPTVRKVAVWFLHKPRNPHERNLFWRHLNIEQDCGVRGWWAFGLLQEAKKEELGKWILWIEDTNWAVRWCVSEYLKKYPEFPKLEKTLDPDLIKEKAEPVVEWYKLLRRLRP